MRFAMTRTGGVSCAQRSFAGLGWPFRKSLTLCAFSVLDAAQRWMDSMVRVRARDAFSNFAARG